ncbi:isochorismate synthase EntC [Buttiauxella agrestis]|uniref:isochorismate synthase n=1 Tax=Buttiauxella agrestis ATCC 33320 TaxID=1006004 RepID=A0A085GIF7_9ENTR|nr:isochorismate synthase EntC [Buttiauxella agrestis]KFC83502.1 isochorismate synthase [Buttiauxella agrestis ATCC 33320]
METSMAKPPQEKQLTSTPGQAVKHCADSFFFMSPYRSFSTSGCFTRLDTPALDGAHSHGHLQTQLREAFDNARKHGIEKPVVVGAIPFDPRQPSALFIPESWQPFSRAQHQDAACQKRGGQALNIASRQAIPEQEKFMEMVAHAATATAQPDIDKVVLSRLIDIETDAVVDLDALLNRLISQNPTSYNFHVPLPDGSSLVGASPELLLRKSGKNFSSLPLAGSARRDKDNIQRDSEIGAQLLRSTKDRHEHGLVTQAMHDVLLPRSQYLTLSDTPELITTPTLWHLATPIYGQIKDSQDNALSLACLLHPTPALSGFPHEAAQKLIAELEPFDRELFGGIVGWCDAEGNGEWVVTIRCARVGGKQVRLFAGAGIVPASSPESEWRETGVKLSTMLNVFGIK